MFDQRRVETFQHVWICAKSEAQELSRVPSSILVLRDARVALVDRAWTIANLQAAGRFRSGRCRTTPHRDRTHGSPRHNGKLHIGRGPAGEQIE